MTKKLNLKQKNIVIATHVYTTGPAQELKDYLLKHQVGKLLFVGHPLFYTKQLLGSGYEYYENAHLKAEDHIPLLRLPALVKYAKDFIFGIYFVRKFGIKWDLYVGSNNFNSFVGLVLKRLGYVEKCVFYVIDYNPNRFKGSILNRIYHLIDRICVKHCDEVWNLSPRMEPARKKYFNFTSDNQKVVPVGVWIDRIKPKLPSQINKNTLVFMGHVLEKQGVQFVIKAIPKIVNKIPDFKFVVVGGGKYIPELEKLAEKNNVSKNVEFTGYIHDHKDLEEILTGCSAAIALYKKYIRKNQLSFTYFADPSKLKVYIGCGLPIILTDVPYSAKEIEEKRMGKLVSYDPGDIANAVVEVLKKPDKFRKNVLSARKELNWNKVFENALGDVL